MKRAAGELTQVRRIQRALINGRPPVGELKTATAAISAAKILYKDLEARMVAAGLHPKPGDWDVSIGYVSPDLSLMGFSPLYSQGEEGMLNVLQENVMLGLIFGMRDKEATQHDETVVMGARPFFVLKPQTDDWFETLVPLVWDEIKYP
jgi:hypothetical protein